MTVTNLMKTQSMKNQRTQENQHPGEITVWTLEVSRGSLNPEEGSVWTAKRKKLKKQNPLSPTKTPWQLFP